MKRRERLLIGAIVAGVLVLAKGAAATLSAPTDTRVVFETSGSAGMSFEGATSEMSLTDQGENVVITVPLANLSTGISLRDRHMKERYLEVPKYPAATLTVSRSALKLPSDDEKVTMNVPASLTLHGQTRPVVVHCDLRKNGKSTSAGGKLHFNMSDFGINVPSYLGVTVKPDVDVHAKFSFVAS